MGLYKNTPKWFPSRERQDMKKSFQPSDHQSNIKIICTNLNKKILNSSQKNRGMHAKIGPQTTLNDHQQRSSRLL